MSRIVRSANTPGCQRTAMRVDPDTTALSSSRRLATKPVASVVNPVIFPPGRARLATRPLPTGSATNVATIGMVVVARLAARAAGVDTVTMTSILSRTSSAAKAGSWSSLPAAQRYSTAMFCPSIHPSSCSPGEMSIVGVGPEESDRKPIRAVFGACCPSAPRGAASAPASAASRKRRRSITTVSSPRAAGPAATALQYGRRAFAGVPPVDGG
jgi:hypothetical protein